jgi:hypothetical protein
MDSDLFRYSIIGATEDDWLLSLRAPHPSKVKHGGHRPRCLPCSVLGDC